MSENIEISRSLHYHRLIAEIPEKAREFGFWVISGRINWPSQAKISRVGERRYEFFSLSHMIGGKGRLHLNGKIMELHPGDAVLMCPGEWHCYGRYDEEPYIEDSVQFCGRLPELLWKYGVIHSGILNMGVSRSLVPIIEKSSSKEPVAWLEAATQLQMLLLQLNKNKKLSPIEMLLETIHNAPASYWWSVSELSELFGGSPDRLRREFLKYTGVLPKHYLEQFKLRQAAEYLITTNKSVAETAFYFGYVDCYHFSRRFSHLFGISPDQYRKRFREQGIQ